MSTDMIHHGDACLCASSVCLGCSPASGPHRIPSWSACHWRPFRPLVM